MYFLTDGKVIFLLILRIKQYRDGRLHGGIFLGFSPAVDVGERIDIPPFQKFIGWDVVMCGVGHMFFGEMPRALCPKSSMA